MRVKNLKVVKEELSLTKKLLMATMKILLLFLLYEATATAGSILSVDDGGVYSGITVRIGDDVPRQYCRRVIDGVQVGEGVQ